MKGREMEGGGNDGEREGNGGEREGEWWREGGGMMERGRVNDEERDGGVLYLTKQKNNIAQIADISCNNFNSPIKCIISRIPILWANCKLLK